MSKSSRAPKNIKISHRGLWNNKNPENTIGAFKRSIQKYLPIELDVHLLKDDTLVVFHDDNLKRMTNIDLDLKNATYEEIRDIKIKNTVFTISTFEEVLEYVNGRVLLDIEIKTDVKSFKICKLVSKVLDNYNGSFMIKSFNPLYIIWFRIYKPEYIRGLLIDRLNKTNKIIKRIYRTIIFSKFFIRFLAKLDFIAYDSRDLPNKKLEKIHKKGLPIYLWTIRNQKLEYTFDGIIFEERK